MKSEQPRDFLQAHFQLRDNCGETEKGIDRLVQRESLPSSRSRLDRVKLRIADMYSVLLLFIFGLHLQKYLFWRKARGGGGDTIN
uniref:Uncharacterized protein n=1 Tax=Cyanothece sp. (strain PCC 7425 / ATCC 29141) TaxID=395961 RepID=B8HJW9_CYAP4